MKAYFKQAPDRNADRKEEYMNREINNKMSLVGTKLNLLSIALVVFCLIVCFNSQAAAQSSHSLAQYQTPINDQLGRDTCWAFAGVAALEAAYNRKYGIVLDLSEQYAFHIPKAMELQPRIPDILPTGIICASGNGAKIVQPSASLLGNAATGWPTVVRLRPTKAQFMTLLSITTPP